MKLRHFMALMAAVSFLFVISTQDLYATHTTQQSLKEQKEKLKISEIESDVHVQLLKNDLILGNEDGGGYYRYNYTWLWLTLIAVAVLVVLLVVAYSSDWWYWY